MDLVAKKNVTSPIWAHFGFKPDGNGKPENLDEPVCRICGKTVFVTNANTTNLRNHLKINHPAAYAALGLSTASAAAQPSTSGQRQLNMAEAFSKATKYKKDSDKWRVLTDSVTRYLVVGMVPFRTVEKRSFKEMLNTFDKQYELPGRKYFSQTAVPALYSKVKDDVQRELQEISNFALTTDMWSSVNMTPYMSLTVHYIAKDWSLKSKCLETSYTPESHTAEHLSECLQLGLHDWGLDEKKLSCITTDNGANIVAAVRQLGWPWLNCFGHNLHLAVTNGVNSEAARTGRAIGLCRSLVSVFSQSWKKKKELIKAQTELQLPQHSLILVRIVLANS